MGTQMGKRCSRKMAQEREVKKPYTSKPKYFEKLESSSDSGKHTTNNKVLDIHVIEPNTAHGSPELVENNSLKDKLKNESTAKDEVDCVVDTFSNIIPPVESECRLNRKTSCSLAQEKVMARNHKPNLMYKSFDEDGNSENGRTEKIGESTLLYRSNSSKSAYRGPELDEQIPALKERTGDQENVDGIQCETNLISSFDVSEKAERLYPFQSLKAIKSEVDEFGKHKEYIIAETKMEAHDLLQIDKGQKSRSMTDSHNGKDGNQYNSLLSKLEKSLHVMSLENKDWSNAIVELSKCVRTGVKTHRKEITAVLVENRLADRFLTYMEVLRVDLVTKLSPEDIVLCECWPSYKRFLTIFWILCDASVNFCQYVLASRLFEYLMMELRVLSTLCHKLNDKSLYLLKAILGIFHNICRHVPSSKWAFRNEGLVAVLRIFLDCDVAMVRVKTLIILSFITSETENEIINTDDENFQFIVQVLKDALISENHMSLKYGMSAAEVLKGLCNLAVNDENKIRIVKNGTLALYEQCLQVGSKEEKRLTVTSLWNLAFHHYNKQKMRDMRGLMEKLHALEFPEGFSDDDEICHAARGTIWELENISAASVDRNYSSSTEKDSKVPHIMISYQWDSQPIMVKVKDKLRQAGYKVWMDVEHMTGSTLEAMALAVEKAAVVLICMSQKYKESPNCRTEAEYVYRLRKDFVPLRLQQDYVPDGWLGMLVGTRLYFDIYTEDIIDQQIPRLVKELRDRGKITTVYDSVDQGMFVPTRMISRDAAPLLAGGSMEVASWSQSDVKSWLYSSGCEELVSRFPTIDGQLLEELQHIQTKAPEFFYSILKSELDFKIMEILKFSKGLRNLTK